MFKKTEIVNVQLEDAVPETSFLHSKYWTKYCGEYRLQLTVHNFLEAYSKTHTEFETYDLALEKAIKERKMFAKVNKISEDFV